jgi:hypothetical protein
MSAQLIQYLEKEIARLTGVVRKLEDAKLALQLGDANPRPMPTQQVKPVAKALQPKQRNRQTKRFYGEVSQKLVEVVGQFTTASNAEVRAELDRQGFKYSSPKAVRKALYNLAKQGKLREVKNGDTVQYQLPAAS